MATRSVSLLAATALALTCSTAIGADSYCDDPNAVAEWNAIAAMYAGSNDWQRLHALWRGCARRSARGVSGTIAPWICSRPSGGRRYGGWSVGGRGRRSLSVESALGFAHRTLCIGEQYSGSKALYSPFSDTGGLEDLDVRVAPGVASTGPAKYQ
jgi:hypothetical protein